MPSSSGILPAEPNDRVIVTGEVSAEFASAARVIDADYHVPFLAHTCMEPLNATADVKSDRAEIWVGCQNPLGFRRDVAAILDMDPEQVTLHNHMMGGGFGRKARPDYAMQVALLSRSVGRPVQLIWSRKKTSVRISTGLPYRVDFGQLSTVVTGWSRGKIPIRIRTNQLRLR